MKTKGIAGRIVVEGAKENNLRNIDVTIPKNKLVVITGVSGSGKSSLAFDTIFAEGYRRYVENLSSYAKFFLKSAKKPKVKKITNLSPAIAIDQKAHFQNPRSTVGTITDIYDYVRLLFANLGVPHCPDCNVEMKKQDPNEIVMQISKFSKGTQVAILAKWERGGNDLKKSLLSIENMGYMRVCIGGKFYKIPEALVLLEQKNSDFKNQADLEVVIDRLIFDPGHFDRERILDSLLSAEKISKLPIRIVIDNEQDIIFSRFYVCPQCGRSLKEVKAKNFSFNSPEGACNECSGLGRVAIVSPEKIVANKKLSISEGAILPLGRNGMALSAESYYGKVLTALSKKYGFSLTKPFSKIPKEKAQVIFYGANEKIEIKEGKNKTKQISWDGIISIMERKYKRADSSYAKTEIERYMTERICPKCKGKRLKDQFLRIKVLDLTIDQFVMMEIGQLIELLKQKRGNFTANSSSVGNALVNEIYNRILPLSEVGLEYLNLDRSCACLSGGEFQRTRLATQLYSGLGGVIYVLDEPSIGLHPRDNKKLVETLQKIKKNNNAVLVVEHDKDIMLSADHVIDLGPGAGQYGGKIIFEGDTKKLLRSKTETAQYLSGRRKFHRKKIKTPAKKFLEIKGASENNLKNLTVKIPLQRFVSVAGVSGSGKSSLINDILAKALRRKIMKSFDDPGKYKKINGIEKLSKVVIVDQSPIGRSPRSNAATYTGVFNHIRELFAQTEAARKKGLGPGHFSFNMRGGRCEYCQGEGIKKIEMHLLNDVYSVCSHCNGTRYNKKVLSVNYHGKNISQVLGMDIEFASHFFSFNKIIKEKLDALCKVGLGYLRLGQNSTELSGGEAQRIKLASELGRKSNGNTLYILDEPSIGLHFSDIEKLLGVLSDLVEKGNSVIVIEHNLDIISMSDYVIELGPEGGSDGGKIIFEGIPEKLAKTVTWTGKAMSDKL